jgi:FtsH-binding integral membrane protein
MIVPNYVPDPLEVPNNITTEPYRHRVAFIRRVTFAFLGSVACIAGAATGPWPPSSLSQSAVWLALVLAALGLWRTLARSSRAEGVVSTVFLPLVLLLCGWNVHLLAMRDIPVWAPGIGVATAAVYAALCGRDYSFVGSFLLSFIASSVVIASLDLYLGLVPRQSAQALSMNAALLAYFHYDLAMLTHRRRRGEEMGAVVDLYRDIFNFFGYALRCIRHWRKHRIWEIAR